MIITLRPQDLIERLLWDKFEYFCCIDKSNGEINKMIEKNEEFQITEKDAFVIGLVNTIKTSDITYKFKMYLKEVLENKNFEFNTARYINKELIIENAYNFKKKFPKGWSSTDPDYNAEMAKIPTLIEQFKEKIESLATIKVQEFNCVKYGNVKKAINKLG